MKLEQLKKKDLMGLKEHETSLRTNIAEKKRTYVMGEITDNKEMSKLRKELARTMTLINQTARGGKNE